MAALGLHFTLLDDALRTRAFDRALKETVRPGDVVADLGCGTGILSLLALKHGAARVYAIDEHPVAEIARIVARENGVEDRLIVVRARAQEARLPERVDVVVSEMLGHAIFNEGLIEMFADARRRLLKKGGRMIPRSVRAMAAPALRPSSDRWPYGVRLETLRALARGHYRLAGGLRRVGPARILADLEMGRGKLPLRLRGRWRVPLADGLACWFDALLSPSVRLSSLKGTHWRPVFFPAPEPLRGRVEASLEFHGGDSISWRFNDLPPQSSLLADGRALAQRTLTDSSVPRLSRARAREVEALALVDGRRTVAQVARRLKGVSGAEAVRRVKSVCLNDGVLW